MNREDISEKLKTILIRILKHDSFEIEDSLTTKDVEGWDSLSHALIIMEIENDFNVKFSLREINRLENMGSLLSLIQTHV